MTKLRRLWPLLAAFFGFLGIAVCAAAILVVWSMGSRLTQANEAAFNRIDATFSAIRGRVLKVQRRVQESKITTEDIGDKLRSFAGKEFSERLAIRLEVGERAERLALGLQQGGLWIEASEDSIRGVQQALEMASSLCAPVDVKVVDPLLEQLAALRRQLKQTTETVDGIRQRLNNMAEGEGLEERIVEIVRLVMRVAATLGELGPRLGESAEIIADAQTKTLRLKSKAHSRIVVAAACAVLLIAWMMAGQVSLCRQG